MYKENIYNNAVKLYNELADNVELLYKEMKKQNFVKLSKQKIMEDYDLYIQSLLCKIASSDQDIDKIELEFIKKIARYKNYFKKFSDEDDLKMNQFIYTKLDNVPYFVQLIAVADNSLKEDGKEEHYAKEMFLILLNLSIAVASMDEKIEKVEIDNATKALEPVMDFFNANNIKFIEEK